MYHKASPSYLSGFYFGIQIKQNCNKQIYLMKHRESYAPINVNPIGWGAGGGVRARGGDLMPGTIPAIGLLIVQSDPGVGTFNFDRQKTGINSEAVTKSVPRGFLKVTLL